VVLGTFKKTLVVASATTISAVGLLGCPALAHARPMLPLAPAGSCKFVGVQVLDEDDGLTVVLPSSGETIQGDASVSHTGQNDSHPGTANGSLTGTAIDITVDWHGGPWLSSHYTGQVNDDHSASGTVNNIGMESHTANWHTKFSDRISCKQAPAAAPTATVNADTDLYDKPSDQGGHVIGMLNHGQVVKVANACSPDAWCILTDPAGAAWGRDLTNN
jgi:hypothetical protein